MGWSGRDLERLAKQAAPPERPAAVRVRRPTAAARWADRRASRRSATAERASGEHKRERQPESDAEDEARRGRDEAQHEGVEMTGGRDGIHKRAVERRPARRGRRPAARGSGEGRPRAGRPRRSERPGASWSRAARPTPCGHRSRGAAGSRTGQDRLAVGTREPVRNAFAASWFGDALTTTPAYVAGTFAAAGTSTVVDLVDAWRRSRRRSLHRPRRARSW